MESPTVKEAWVAGVIRGLVGVPDADIVLAKVEAELDRVLELARRVESGARRDRIAAVRDLISIAGCPTPELIDVAMGATRAGIRDAGTALRWSSRQTEDIERRALASLVDIDRRLEAVATTVAGG